ncbi:unnamed protein product, partial [Musa banksii]
GVGRACGWVPRPREDRRPVVPVGESGRSPSSPSPPTTGAAPRLVEAEVDFLMILLEGVLKENIGDFF